MTESDSSDLRLKRLVLLCELDRLHLRLALRPRESSKNTIAGLPQAIVSRALSFTQLLPGRLGRLSRGFALGSAFFKVIKPFVRASRLTG